MNERIQMSYLKMSAVTEYCILLAMAQNDNERGLTPSRAELLDRVTILRNVLDGLDRHFG